MFVNATVASGGPYHKTGGSGGWVQASLSMTAGQTMCFYVGGDEDSGHNYNGGRRGDVTGGGGAADIRTIPGNLTSRLIEAGGGGGDGYCDIRGKNGTKIRLRFCFLISTIFCL